MGLRCGPRQPNTFGRKKLLDNHQVKATDIESLFLYFVDGHNKAKPHWELKTFEVKRQDC